MRGKLRRATNLSATRLWHVVFAGLCAIVVCGGLGACAPSHELATSVTDGAVSWRVPAGWVEDRSTSLTSDEQSSWNTYRFIDPELEGEFVELRVETTASVPIASPADQAERYKEAMRSFDSAVDVVPLESLSIDGAKAGIYQLNLGSGGDATRWYMAFVVRPDDIDLDVSSNDKALLEAVLHSISFEPARSQ